MLMLSHLLYVKDSNTSFENQLVRCLEGSIVKHQESKVALMILQVCFSCGGRVKQHFLLYTENHRSATNCWS